MENRVAFLLLDIRQIRSLQKAYCDLETRVHITALLLGFVGARWLRGPAKLDLCRTQKQNLDRAMKARICL